MNEWMNKWMNEWMDGWISEWTYKCPEGKFFLVVKTKKGTIDCDKQLWQNDIINKNKRISVRINELQHQLESIQSFIFYYYLSIAMWLIEIEIQFIWLKFALKVHSN